MKHRDIHKLFDRAVKAAQEGTVSRREALRLGGLLGVSSAVAYGALGMAMPATAQEAKPKGGTLRIGNWLYDISAPHQAWSPTQPLVMGQVVEYLVRMRTDNTLAPNLLEGWNASDDLRTWTLNVRPGVTWHDGRAFTADDVVWNLTHLLSDDAGSSYQGLAKGYMLNAEDTGEVNDKGRAIIKHSLWSDNAIEAVDDMTVRLNLKSPQIAVMEHLTHFPCVMLDPAENGVFGPGSNGTGAFTMTAFEAKRQAVLEAADSYWGEGPHLDRVEFIELGSDEQPYVNALISQQVDGVFRVVVDFLPLLDGQAHLTRYEADTSDTTIVRMNLNHKPYDDPRVRKALRLATDRATLNEIVFGDYASVAEHHHVSPIHADYVKLPDFPYDVEAAKALLAEAGHPDGFAAEISIQSAPAFNQRMAEVLKEQWAKVGVDLSIKVLPGGQYWDVWLTAPLGQTVWGHRPLGSMLLSLAYKTGVAWNETAYSNAEFDGLLEEIEATGDLARRQEIMSRIETIMQEDGPIVQTSWRKTHSYYHNKVVGFEMHPTQMVFANELAISDS